MSFTVKLHGVVVGRSELEERDPATRTAHGAFRKGVGYELVEPIFALRDTAADLERYRKARRTLALELYDAAGTLLQTSSLDVERAGDDDGVLRVRATINDRGFWDAP